MKRNIKKIIVMVIIFGICFGNSIIRSDAKNYYNWYTPRNGSCQPIFSKTAESVSEHGAYYIDKSLSDESDKKVIYITFDFGYENGNVEKILDVLDEEGVKAAFFILDNPVIKNTDLVKKIAESGHLICNHTKNHKDLTACTKEEIEKNLGELERIYEQKTGYTMSKYFRFPEGKYSFEALDIIKELGYKTVFWSFAYADWDNVNQPGRDSAMKKILSNTHNGAVILLHPTSETNANIMKDLIREWRNMGYEFGTLDELCSRCDY